MISGAKMTIRQSQPVKFLLVGGLNTALCYLVYAGAIYLGFVYYFSSLIALAFGVVVSFFAQGRLVFQASLKGRFWRFVLMWGVLYLVNIVFIRLIAAFGIDYYFAGLVAAIPVVAISFLLQKFYIFKD